MRVFKFGGASVKDEAGVRNLAKIVSQESGELVVVLSAMGKMTNAFERLINAYFNKTDEKWEAFSLIKNFHLEIMSSLFTESHPAYQQVALIFKQIEEKISQAPSLDFNFEYDQLVGYGEMLSTTIVNAFMNQDGIASEWVDIRSCLKTDSNFREGIVDFELTKELMQQTFNFKNTKVYLTQGFLGATTSNLTTSLGREGSDYTAAVIAHTMNAEKVEIWKDVPGILNADPSIFDNCRKIEKMSYREAIELTFFGAKVIHPKTMKPLLEKDIPLQVRSFIDATETGTLISNFSREETPRDIPFYILKPDQVLLSIVQPDMSFMSDANIAEIFSVFGKLDFKVNLVQHSALQLTVSINRPDRNFEKLIKELSENFELHYNENMELLTIRYYNHEVIAKETNGKDVFVEQKTRNTVRLVMRDKV